MLGKISSFPKLMNLFVSWTSAWLKCNIKWGDLGARDMAPWLDTLAALVEDLVLFPAIL